MTGAARDRAIARQALELLAQGGYKPTEGGVMSKDGQPVAFEIMVRDREEESLALNFASALRRIGVMAQPRLYDEVQ